MDIDTPAHSLFPHSKLRGGQLDFYNDSRTVAESGKILFANAPTGIGKTAASLSGVLEAALPAGRKVLFLTHRNSHHIQAMIEANAIIANRKAALAAIRPLSPTLRVVDKISKSRMCLLRAQDPSDDSPYLLCEIARCKYARPKPSIVESLLETPISATQSVERSKKEFYCAHYAALGAVGNADVIVCDYTYLFEEGICGAFLSRLGRPLSECDVIIDEAHNLPERIMDINARQIGEKTMKNALKAISDSKKHFSEEPEMLAMANRVAGYLKNALSPALRKMLEGADAAKEEMRLGKEALAIFHPDRLAAHGLSEAAMGGKTPPLSAILRMIADEVRLRFAKGGEGISMDVDGLAHLSELAAFLHSAEAAATGNPAYGVFLKTSPDLEMFRLRCALFDPSIIAQKAFAEVHSAVLMSGTLIGKRGICELLGIDAARAMKLEESAYLSPFDAERKRVMICNWVSSRQRERADGKGVKTMAAIIDEAARACAPHSLAIFYPSYEYLRVVKDELVLHGFRHETEMRGEKHAGIGERKERIEARTFSDKPVAFHGVIGGSYSEGMDFRNNPFKLIIIAGFPFPKPDARHDAYEGYLEGKFKSRAKASELASVLPATIKSVQAMGRGIRKAEDWCYCLLIDDRFARHLAYFQPSLNNSARVLAGNRKKDIWDDIYGFMEKMDGRTKI
ncbi:MAG: ATP-dependent DNA helicase [Candidatus Micrarchaeia archaeon]